MSRLLLGCAAWAMLPFLACATTFALTVTKDGNSTEP